ncbi:unnamed protein product [Symbiodinium natans]|uniref:Uncharacterized protein n=1 Tax=Symbiodinium natans TaxID=878477 RepID=A0A812TYE5_9DINO|nr:unnamed protein product [Symbiodinium natans]
MASSLPRCLQLCLLCVAVRSVESAKCVYPGGECYELRLQKCKDSANWTIHGLWPEWDNGCPGPKFDVSALTSIRSEMEAKWISCPEFGEANEVFWQHEWEKHGTCSRMDEASFFKKALQLYDQYKVKCGKKKEGDCAICFNEDLVTLETCPPILGLVV